MSTGFPDLGNWVLRPFFSAVPRSEAAAFVIGDFAYLATGYESINGTRLKDVWQFDATNNSWKQMADFAGGPRNSAISFSIGNKGYLGTGFDGNNLLKDFWEYDPVADTWIRKADFAGSARYNAVAFGILNYGYVSCGYDTNYLKDFWKYDPAADTWKQLEPLGGSKGNPRAEAVAFVYRNRGYIVTGQNGQLPVNDFWVFDPSRPDSSAWSALRPISKTSADHYDDGYSNIVRSNAAAFVLLFISMGI
jgi:N-acetylneuraminic acid mutarotase